MAGRGNAPLRWGDEERRLVFQYLQDGRIDTNRIESAAYLRSIKVREAVWDRHANKNFYQNIRRMVTTHLAGQQRSGGRRGGGNEDEAAEDNGDDDDDDAFELDEEEPPNQRRESLFLFLCSRFANFLIRTLLTSPQSRHKCINPLPVWRAAATKLLLLCYKAFV
jgi:hypothetical protein